MTTYAGYGLMPADAPPYEDLDKDQLMALLKRCDALRALSQRAWIAAAEAALSGDVVPLRNRVELAKSNVNDVPQVDEAVD